MADVEAQDYAFHVALSEQIAKFADALAQGGGGVFQYRGMDFRRVFALHVYYAAAPDPALFAWYEKTRGKPVYPPPFTQDLAHLLAQQWFGDVGPLPWRLRLRRRLRRARRWLGDPTRRPKRSHGNLAKSSDVLFFAQMTRFRRYLEPLPRHFAGRYAWLVPAESWAEDLQMRLFDTGEPFLTLDGLRPSSAPMGAALRRYAPELALEVDSIDRALARLRPKVIVLPEGNHPRDELVNLVAERRGVPVLCLQQGWSPLIHPGFQGLHYAAMSVWGQGFCDLLANANPAQRFFVGGHHKLAKREQVSQPAGVLFLCQGNDKWLGTRGEQLHLSLAEKLAATRPDLPVYVRPHPVAPLSASDTARLSALPNIIIQAPDAVPLAQAFRNVSISVSIFSSTILESAAAGVIPVVFNMTTMPRYEPDVEMAGIGFESKSLDDALTVLLRLLDDGGLRQSLQDRLDDFVQKFFVAFGADAEARIVAEITRLGGLA